VRIARPDRSHENLTALGVLRESIDSAVCSSVPRFVRVSLHVSGINAGGTSSKAYALLSKAAEVAGRHGPVELRHIQSWRQAYEATGIGAEVVTPVEALAAWSSVAGGIPSSGPLADLVSAFSLMHAVPAAAYHLPGISGSLWLGPARGIERFDRGPDGPSEIVPAGELILSDSAGNVMARRWHSSQGRQVVVGGATRHALVHLDLLPPLTERTRELTDAFSRLCTGFLGAIVQAQTLSDESPTIAWRQ
jgi:DNA/RNA-binding domain of Phe-tRNA-synthetase-like protein